MHAAVVRYAFPLVAAGVLLSGSALAATPAGSPPSTYDYDPATPGTQAPRSVAAADYRSVRTYQVTIPVLVPTSDLQAVLPDGFTAKPSSEGAATSTLNMAFFLDQRFEHAGATHGPVSAVLVSTTARNGPADRDETVFPAFEASGDVDALNAAFGPGSARLADVSVRMVQSHGTMDFAFEVDDAELGLHLTASATSPSTIDTRSVSDPVRLPFRTLDGHRANQAFVAASQSDGLVVPTTAAQAKLHSTGNRLPFVGGSLQVVGLGPNITFARDVEFVVHFQQG